jgi:hypothetical protein
MKMKMATQTTGTTDLSNVLLELGVDVRRTSGREISGCCPVHEKRTGRADGSPSWSMNSESGLWICHSCGARGTLAGLVSELTGNPDSVSAVNQLLIETGINRLTAPERVEFQPEIDWVSYSRFSLVPHQELVKRHLDADVALAHGIKWNMLKQAWVIPIVSPFGANPFGLGSIVLYSIVFLSLKDFEHSTLHNFDCFCFSFFVQALPCVF